MSRRDRILKTPGEELAALDDHLFLLKSSLTSLHSDDSAYAKLVSTELRALLCLSSGTEGLLWRVTDQLGVSDSIHALFSGVFSDHLGLAGEYDHLLVSQNIRLPSHARAFGFRDIIKTGEALRYRGVSITYEQYIKILSQQVGAAHEAEAVDPVVIALREYSSRGSLHAYDILAFLAEVTLQLGERALKAAQGAGLYSRCPRPGFGDISLTLITAPRQIVDNERLSFIFGSHISELYIEFLIDCKCWQINLFRSPEYSLQQIAGAPVENENPLGLTFQYSSNKQLARILRSESEAFKPFELNLGWLDARETTRWTKIKKKRMPAQISILNCAVFDHLTSSQELSDFSSSPAQPCFVTGKYPTTVLPFDLSKGLDSFFEDGTSVATDFPP